MKKFFTLLLAVAMTTVVFGQITPKKAYRLEQPVSLNERSDWYGTTSAEYFTEYGEGEIYFITFPAAGNISGQIEKVSFGWQETGMVDDGNGGEIEINFDPNFNIKIFVGGNTNWIVQNPDPAQAVYSTDDMSNMGTCVYTQTVDASTRADRGVVTVNLTTPFDIASANGQQIWVGIECLGNTAGYIANLDNPDYNYNWAINLNKYIAASTQAERLRVGALYYTDANHTALFAASCILGIYVNDGQAYQPKSDWTVELYDPEDQAQYPDEVTSIYVDNYTDSIYFYGGAFNMGVDSAYGRYYTNLYIDGTNPIYFEENEPVQEDLYTYEQYYGWRFGPVALMGVDQMEEEGITFPFDVCYSVTYESAPGYNGVDPDLTNNTKCVTYTNQEPIEDGIAENTNTLTVSPNPASTVIRVDNAAGAQISIFNIAGQEVMAIEAANANETINVANLTEGVYVVRVVNGNEVATSKVSIVR